MQKKAFNEHEDKLPVDMSAAAQMLSVTHSRNSIDAGEIAKKRLTLCSRVTT